MLRHSPLRFTSLPLGTIEPPTVPTARGMLPCLTEDVSRVGERARSGSAEELDWAKEDRWDSAAGGEVDVFDRVGGKMWVVGEEEDLSGTCQT